jgi:hypothetical protein
MRALSLFLLLLSLPALAGSQKTFDLPASGSRTSGYIHPWTICEYDGTIDVSSQLVDKSGVRVLPNGNAKPQHDLAQSNSPTLHTSSLRKQDGNYWPGRTFNGLNQSYSRTHHDNFNLFDGNFSVTVVFRQPSTAAGADTIFQHYASNNGMAITSSIGSYIGISLFNGSGSLVTSLPITTVNDGHYHVFQTVRKSDYITALYDGTRSVSKYCSGYGTDTSTTISLAGGTFFEGSILYFRFDAEALSDEVLEFERQALMGWASNTSLKTPPTFTRASTGYAKIQGKLYPRMNNSPRIQTDGAMLIEETRTNLVTYSETLDSWPKTLASFTSVNNASPQPGNNTACLFHEDATPNQYHYIRSALFAVTGGSTYTFSGYFKKASGNYIFLELYDSFTVSTGTFNLNNGLTTLGSTAQTEFLGDGWYRFSIKRTMNASATGAWAYVFSMKDDGLTNQYDGYNRDDFYAWGLQVELGSHPTSYVATTSSAAARSVDYYSIPTTQVNTNALVRGDETWWTDFSSDVASTGTVSLGGKTFTQAGDTKHRYSPDLGHYYEFDGTGDWLSINDSFFNVGNNWTMIYVIAPTCTTGTYLATKGSSTADQRGWFLATNSNRWDLTTSSDGTAATVSTASSGASACVTGKTSLITVSFSYSGNQHQADSTANVFVDELAGTSTIMKGPVFANSSVFSIGAYNASSAAYVGKIHYMAILSGTYLVKADHDALYAKFKKDGILPLALSSTSAKKKVKYTFDARTLYASSTDIGDSRPLIDISELSGVNNRFSMWVDGPSGSLNVAQWDSTATAHMITSSIGNPVVFNRWHTYVVYFDYSNLANSYLSVDGSTALYSTKTLMTGSATVTNANTFFKLGYAGTTLTGRNLEIKNLRIQTYE